MCHFYVYNVHEVEVDGENCHSDSGTDFGHVRKVVQTHPICTRNERVRKCVRSTRNWVPLVAPSGSKQQCMPDINMIIPWPILLCARLFRLSRPWYFRQFICQFSHSIATIAMFGLLWWLLWCGVQLKWCTWHFSPVCRKRVNWLDEY